MCNEVTNEIVNSEHAYPIFFVNKQTNEVMCLECMRSNSTEYNDYVFDYHYEGDALNCDECYDIIESAYGPLED